MVVATEPWFRPLPAAEIVAAARAAGIPVQTLIPAERAIVETFANAPENALVVVTGSFYVICETPYSLRGG